MIDGDTRVIDVEGRTVVPGLIDAHVHFARAGFTWDNEVRWGTVTSLAEGLDLIADRARSLPPSEWITVIGGWHPFQFVENRHPTIEDLDRVAPDNPVSLVGMHSHASWLNSKALEAAGIPVAERAADIVPLLKQRQRELGG